MIDVSGTGFGHKLFRGAVIAAVLAPIGLLAACSPPPPAVVVQPEPPPPAPVLVVPPARG